MPDSTLLQKLAEAENEIAALREQVKRLREQVKRLREALRKIAIGMVPVTQTVRQFSAEAYAFEK